MQALFAPAIALMNRLRYPYKFLLLGLAGSTVILVLLATVFITLDRDITTAQREIAGLHVLKPLNRMVQSMQQHRGLSAGVLNGNEAMREQRATKEREVNDALTAVAAELPPTLRESPRWQTIRNNWEEVRTQGLGWSAADNLARQTAMIGEALALMVDVADDSELSLDPEMDTYYFMDTVVSKMPAMLEPLGIMRARGTGILTKKEITAQQRVDIASLLAQMNATQRAQNDNLAKVMHFTPAQRERLAGPAREFSNGTERIFALVRDDLLSEKFATAPQDYFTRVTQLIDLGYQVMYETLMPQFEQQLAARMQHAQHLLWMNALLALVVMAVVAYLSIGTYYSVINSVNIFSQGARRLAGGDLTVHFGTTGHDELHAAGEDLNDMTRSLRTLIGGVKQNAEALRQAADLLATSSQEISASAATQSDSASSMAAAVEEMTVGVDHIAKNALDAQRYSQQSDKVAADGSRIVDNVVREIEDIAVTVRTSAQAVEVLGEQSRQISSIVGTIKEIADQTNLLALNAAIEAARAGESGRGFAVVADEVRKLAERTAKSTQEITTMIESIQAGTTNAVHSMQVGVERVGSGVVQAQATGGAISQVQAQAQQVVEAVSEITTALREQAAASTQIAQNVERIAQMAEQNNAAAATNADTARQLRQLAEALRDEVERFHT
jgi:methyl-accepting chemotaxis protein